MNLYRFFLPAIFAMSVPMISYGNLKCVGFYRNNEFKFNVPNPDFSGISVVINNMGKVTIAKELLANKYYLNPAFFGEIGIEGINLDESILVSFLTYSDGNNNNFRLIVGNAKKSRTEDFLFKVQNILEMQATKNSASLDLLQENLMLKCNK
ncbi:MAG: hypothetical protein ACXVCE_12380 [Bacteriovorax sp.]